MIDPAAIDGVFRRLTRELWIVTAAAGERSGGLLASWVLPASIDAQQPTLLVALDPGHFTCELVRASGSFAAHLLRAEQIELAWNFACDSGRDRDKFVGQSATVGESGAPLLPDCLARLEARVTREFATPERVYLWGAVIAGEPFAAEPALTDQAFFAAISPERRTLLGARRQADIDRSRRLAAESRSG